MGKDYKPEDSCDFLYWCTNEDCLEYKKLFVIQKPYSDEFEEELCSNCKESLYNKGIRCEEPINITFSKLSLMDSQQKMIMLKKRSHEHFKKEIKDVQVEKIRNYDKNPKAV